MLRLAVSLVFLAAGLPPMAAQELPYFITYSHDLEEPGSLEIETKLADGHPQGGGRFNAAALELEYGTRAWWTSELYLEGQSTASDSTVFTGLRIENRIRPLMTEHWINPALYVELEDINEANRSLLEVVGHDTWTDLAEPNAIGRAVKDREAELKLILSSNTSGWNISENLIFEKNLRHAPWEFGYALAASRPLRLDVGSNERAWAPQNFSVGAELYGGLGDRNSPGLHETSHYFAPVVSWGLPGGVTLSASPGFGLNGNSLATIFRLGTSYELGQVSRLIIPRRQDLR